MRLYAIMYDLLNQKDYCSLDDFTKKYDVSKRTIQNDLAYLMKVSSYNGFRIHTKRGRGYLLEVDNEKLLKDFIETLNENVLLDQKNRSVNILTYLILQNDYISMDKVAQTFQISKTLVKKEMNEVADIAQSHHFQLERKSHYGIRITGDDNALKNYLVEEYFNDSVLVKHVLRDIEARFSVFESQLIELLNQENLKINYHELLNVTGYIKIMIYFSENKHEISEKYEFQKDDTLHYLAQNIVSLLFDIYQIQLNVCSIEGLLNILQKNVKKRIDNTSFSKYLKGDIEQFLIKIDETYDTSFLQDQDFKTLLLTHVSLLIDRLHNKISYQNPLANELNITNPMVFNIAIQFCDMLYDQYGVQSTFDEIGFVALHFAAHMEKEKQLKLQSYNKIGVVCSSGGGSAYMIKTQIESLFHSAQVETFSFLKQEDLLEYDPDLIFTVIPLNFKINKPIIYIKELLSDRDLYRIKQILQYDDYDPYILVNDEPFYYSFFSKEFYQVVNDDDYEHLIFEMAQELEKKGYGKEGYAQLVMAREAFVSTVYMNGVCIPHPIETDANQNMISVAVLEQPFLWHDKEVKIVFMICLKKNQIEVYKAITKKLYQFMQEPKYIKKMIQIKSFENMMSVIKEM